MKKVFLSVLLVLFISCAKQPSVQVQTYSIEQFYKNISIWGGAFSPDESQLLVTSNETGIYNVYALSVADGQMEALTSSETESQFAVSYFPNDKRVLFSADKGGNENNHIYLLNEDKSVLDITPFENSKSQFYSWSHDKESFFFASNQRNPKFFDLYEKRIDQLENLESYTLVFQNDEGFDLGDISKNKQYLTLHKSNTSSDNDLYLYDLSTKKLSHLSKHEGDAEYQSQFFDLANENLYYLSNENSEFMYLAKYHISDGRIEKVFETNWDVRYAYYSYNEKYRVIGINEDGRTSIQLYDFEAAEEVNLPDIPGGSISSVSISKSEKQIRLTVSTSASPNNTYVYNFKTKQLTKLTNSLNPEINKEDLVEGKVIRYSSYDGLEIPAILYTPKIADSKNKVPALVWVHGGPGGQSKLSYFALIQYLVNHGYAILAVNNRGSSGYGKSFYKMDDQRHGDVDLKDCIAAKEYLKNTGVIDMDKVGIIGGSYGGYMVMAALTFAPEEFDVGVNIFGVTNWLRTLKSIPPYWESYRLALYNEMGDPFSADSVRLYNISPVFHTEKVTKPLMVLQGANDPRVLQVESDEIVAGIRENGVPVEYVLFPDEGHGFRKKDNEIEGYGKVKVFLDKYLKEIL